MKRLTRFDLNLLRVFDAIHAKGGVSAAARHLNLSQPAISHALGKLRDAFDDRLFVRQGNKLVPTPAARALALPIRQALRSLDSAIDGAAMFDPAQSTREFRIGVRLSGEMPRFSSLVARVFSEAPHIALASVTFRRRDLVMGLANGDLDLALDVALPPDEQLCRVDLGPEPLVVAARQGHPQVDGAIDLDTYVALPHVVATARPHGPGIEDLELRKLGLQRRVAVRCQHAITAWHIVASSDMLCTLPRSHADALDAIWPIQLVEPPFAIEPNNGFLYWHQAGQNDPGLSWLRAIIVEELSR